MSTVIGAASPTDLPAVIRLLDASGLPHRDVTAALLAHYLLAKRGAALVGVVGLEPLGTVGLLRSLAVASSHRGHGLGVELTRALERYARDLNVAKLYLLTATAERLFGKLGYQAIPREDVPPPIQATTEYRELCSSTSVCMVKSLD